MSTEFYNRNWRMPKSSNSSKVSNYSMSFDGSSQKITFDTINLGTSNSVSAWAKRNNPTTSSEFLIGGSFGFGYGVYFYQNSIIYIRNTSGTTLTFSNSAITTALSRTDWVHWTFIRNYSASTVDIYVDGTLAESVSSSAGLDSISSIGGSGQLSGAQYIWNGQIDHVAIFDYALSASQVTSLYGNSTDGVGNPMAITGGRKPVAYYPIGDYAAFNGSEYLVNNGALSDYVFDFDIGTNDYVDLGSGISQSFSELSISTWINVPSSASGAYDTIIRRGTWSAGAFELRNNASYAGLKFAIYPGTANVTTTGVTLNDGNWHHILITYDGTNVKIYVDGSLNNSSTNGTGATGTSTQITTIGASDQGTSRHYEGKISNLVLWDSDQSANISNIYNNGTPQTTYTTSPTGWWKLDASATFDGSNWSIPDDSSNSNTGTSNGMTAGNLVQSNLNITTPYSRYALDFDGTGDRINYGVNSVFDFGTSDFAWSFWLNYESHTNYAGIFFTGSSSSTYRLKFQTSGQILFMQNADGDSQVADLGTDITGTGWHHIVLSRSSGTITTFLDGSQVDTDTRAGNINQGGADFIVGANGSSYLNGQLSNISIWNAALTSAQVTELYNQGKPGNLNSHSAYSNLVSWWQLGENMSFNSNVWTVLNEVTTGPNGQGFNISPGESAIVNGVGTSANGLSDGMGGADNIIGDAPYSTANAVSYGMGVDALSTDVPS